MRHGRIPARAVGYWVSTGLLAFQFLLGGVMSVARVPTAVSGAQHLGYPLYFALILGTSLAVVHTPGPRSTERAELQTA